ncbi:hypothetical protein [Actinacidiphila alni]|uniref:hypothetical protein n=1 Tax=Actinacidiphila alni TaxID=380248 RepID=UPI003454422D
MRRLPVVVLLLAASAAAGCTTVSAPPVPVTVTGGTAPRVAVPDGGVLLPPPDHAVLETAEPGPAPVRTPSPVPVHSPRPAPRAAAPHPGTTPGQRPVPRSRRAAPPPAEQRAPDVTLPGGAGVCALGETYGGWASDSDAARICRRSYGG